VDFTGWRHVEFPLGDGGRISLAQVEYLIVFFNGIPAGRTVSCVLDEIELTCDAGGIRRPAFTIGGQALLFPVTLAAGERLAYAGSGPALVRGRDGQVRTRCTPTGRPPVLRAGTNRVRFGFDDKATGEFCLRLQAAKQYR